MRKGSCCDDVATGDLFAFEQRQEEDYRLQGTTDFDTEELLLVRANLKKSQHLRAAAIGYWEAMGKHEHEDIITETEYRFVHARITKALAPELSEEEAKAAAREDWDDDLGGATEMTLEMYLEGLIGIADQWTDTIDELDYCVFLNQLLRRITRRKRCELWERTDLHEVCRACLAPPATPERPALP